jgi:hypothetical protein
MNITRRNLVKSIGAAAFLPYIGFPANFPRVDITNYSKAKLTRVMERFRSNNMAISIEKSGQVISIFRIDPSGIGEYMVGTEFLVKNNLRCYLIYV